MKLSDKNDFARIGIDCRLWDETGVGRYIRNLVKNLQKIDKKNQYVLFVLKKDVDEIKFTVHSSQFTAKIANIRWHSIKEQIEFPKILSSENLDLVHFPYFSVPIFYKKPFVVTIHDLIINSFPTGKASTLPLPAYFLKRKGYDIVLKKSLRKAKKIITVSNTVSDELQKTFNISKEKIAVTYEGIDPMISDKGSKINRAINYKLLATRYFLYVGNFYPHKNTELLVQAFGRIVNEELRIKNLKLIMIGKEDYFYKRLEEKIQAIGLEKDILFKHNVNDEELAKLYINAIAFVTPSLMEGFGLPALEAMANKCLVLASDIAVYREILKDNAIYFDPENVKNISEAMSNVLKLSEKEKQNIVSNAYEYSKKFSWEKMARETLKIYESSISL